MSQEVRWQPRRQGDRCRTSRTGEATRRLAGTAGHQTLPCSSSFFKPIRPTRSWACSGSAPSNHKWISVTGKTLEPECRYNSFHGHGDQIRPCDSRTGILPMQGSQQGGLLPGMAPVHIGTYSPDHGCLIDHELGTARSQSCRGVHRPFQPHFQHQDAAQAARVRHGVVHVPHRPDFWWYREQNRRGRRSCARLSRSPSRHRMYIPIPSAARL